MKKNGNKRDEQINVKQNNYSFFYIKLKETREEGR